MALGFDGSIRIDTKIDTKGFSSGIKSLGSSLTKLAGIIGVAFGTAAIINFGKEAVNAASQLQNAWMGLESIVEGQGRSFSKAQSFINDYISDGLVPLENAVTSYKNLAARGYDDEQIQKTLVALKDAAAFGRQASYSLGDAVSSATEGLRQENSVLVDNAGVTKNVAKMWDDYAKSIGTTANNLTQQQKIQAEVNGILEETKFQTGDAALLTTTYSGQISLLAFNFQQLKVAVGNAIIPIVQAVLPGINAIISALTKLANVFAQVTALLFGKSTGLSKQASTQKEIASTGGAAAAATDKLADATEGAGTAAKKAEKDMKGVLASFDELNILATSTEDSVSGAAGGLSSGVASDLGIEELETGGELFEGAEVSPEMLASIEALKKELEALQDALRRIWEVFAESWENNKERVFGSFTDMLKSVWELLKSIGGAFTEVWTNGTGEEILNTIFSIISGIFELVSTLADKFREAWEANGNGVAIWQSILDIIQLVLDFVDRLVASTVAWASDLNLEPLVTAFRELLEAIEPLVAVILEGLALAYENVLLPFAKWLIEDVSPVALNLVAAAVEELTGFLEKLIALLSGDMSFSEFLSSLTPLESALLSLAAAFGTISLAGAVGNAVTAVKTFFTAVQGFTKTGLLAKLAELFLLVSGGAHTFSQAVSLVFGPGSVIAGIASIVGGAVLAITNFLSMLENGFSWANEALMVLGVAIAAVGAVILGAPAFITGVIAAIIAAIGTAVVVIKENWESIKEAFSAVWEGIKETWNTVASWFKENVIDPVVEYFSAIVETISGFFEGTWILIQAVWKLVSDWFKSNVIDPLINFFSPIVNAISNLFSTLWDKIKGIWSVVSSWFNENVIKPIVDFFSPIVETVSGFFSNLWDKIVNVWESAGYWFDENVAEPINDAFQSVGDFVKGVFNGIIMYVELMINRVINGINGFIDGFNSLVSKAADFIDVSWSGVSKLPTVSLPRLANGAVIPPNQQFAAILGDQRSGKNIEAPASLIKQMVSEALQESSGLTGSETITVVVNLDGREVARNQVKHINNMTRAAGKPVLLI